MKGGEKVEIGNIGAIQSAIPSTGGSLNPSGKSANSFSSVFANTLSGASQSSDRLSVNEQANGLTGEELAGLVQFLQVNDILELENGSDLLEKTMLQTDVDMVALIEEQLNIPAEELLQLLTKLYKQLTATDENVTTMDLVNKSEGDSSEEDMNAAILSLLQAISSLQIQNVKLVPGKEFGEAMKAVKLFDLLAAQQDSFGNETRLREFIKSIQDKLEVKLNAGAPAARDEYLQKTFNTLVQEMNGKNSVLPAEVIAETISKTATKADSIQPGFLQFQQLSKPEQLTLMTSAQRPVSADQLIEQFESILSKSKFVNNGGTQKLFIKLNPEHLGALRIELIQKDSMLIAKILTSTTTAKELMDSQLNGLKQAFTSQNIQIERVEIAQQFTGQESKFNREHQQQQQERQQSKEEQKEQQSNDNFIHSFEEALLNTQI